jgi:PAC2 family
MLGGVLYEVHGSPTLRDPALVAGIEGWVDAAGAGSSCASHIADGGELLVTFDTDQLLDYRSRRPVLDVVDGRLAELAWPSIEARRVETARRDILVLTGPEPDMRWKELSRSLGEVAKRFGVTTSVSLGAIGAAVPHTRPTPVLATASRRDLLGPEDSLPGGLLRVPAAALNLVELGLSELGIPSVGFWAQVPHYVTGPYAPAVIALLERVNRHLGTDISPGSLQDAAITQRAEIDEAVAARPESRDYVTRLEELTDEARVPSGEDLAAEVERFLREAGGGSSAGGGGPSPFSGS